jgi:4-hydroxybenzoate polyprenyltransferase
MSASLVRMSAIRAAAGRYLSCLRLPEILVLQGSPLLGAAFALQRPSLESLTPLLLLVAGNLCLVAHVFLINDWSGLRADLADPRKAARVFTAGGVRAEEVMGLLVFLLALGLLFFARLGSTPFCLAVAIAVLSALYSLPVFDWKGKPLLSSAAHLAGGTLHFLLGYSVAHAVDARGVAIGLFFALTFAAGHLTQELRDYDGDAQSGIRTNAVSFGRRRTFLGSLVLFTLAHGLLFALALLGILPRPLAALIVLYPLHLSWSVRTWSRGLTHANICRLQARYRALYAVIGLAMVAALWGGWLLA